MNALTEQRIKEVDREIETARAEYERALRDIRTATYQDQMMDALIRINDLLAETRSEHPEFQALVLIGRIGEIVRPFASYRGPLHRLEELKERRRRLEHGG